MPAFPTVLPRVTAVHQFSPWQQVHALCLVGCLAACAQGEVAVRRLEYNRDIRPILSDKCFQCHGPDSAKREAGLRLDVRQIAIAPAESGATAIVPAKPAESELLVRINAADEAERMPPAETHKPLKEAEKKALEAWITQGAEYQPHWSLISPVRLAVPKVTDPTWPRNPIDHFVLARLEAEGLKPSPTAERAALLRRVSFDLTGLPPTLAELDAFLADASPDAYEKVVDRLLASPRYGERMAAVWLDAARYADTNGYQIDNQRTMWRWRDWVLEAFNSNMPFDRFTIEQLAGDLLPQATLDQQIASGFNRNHRITAEGGSIPEEFRVEYVADRAETTASVWLGLTMGCARCHDHKFDPVTQKEFYEFFAFFNNVEENGVERDHLDDFAPKIKAPTRTQIADFDALTKQVSAAEVELRGHSEQLEQLQAQWQASLPAAPSAAAFRDKLVAHLALDGDTVDAARTSASATWREGQPTYQDAPLGRAARFDGKRSIEIGDVADFDKSDSFSLSAWVYPLLDGEGAIIAKSNDAEARQGFILYASKRALYAQLVHRWPSNSISVHTTQPLSPDVWHHLAATFDGSGRAAGVKIYVDGAPAATLIQFDGLDGSIHSTAPLSVGGREATSRFAGAIDDVRIYNRVLGAQEIHDLAVNYTLGVIRAVEPPKRNEHQRAYLLKQFMASRIARPYREIYSRIEKLGAQRKHLEESFPWTMVMQEMPTPREAFVLTRGQYDAHGERVTAGVPAAVAKWQVGAPRNRLGLAQWLVNPAHPLTSRVAVNRLWEMKFGVGLVKSSFDFGAQGESPSHGELLDWLATEFVRLGWDVKAMHRLMVTSATYCQSSRLAPGLRDRDPENRLLARGPRFRLPAEMVRDQALAASGLLVEKLGGPSVKPYQPAGLWEELANGGSELTAQKYQQDQGDALYRRSVYTFWKRTVTPTTMAAFDAPSREICTLKRTATNTPLQALALLNDTTYVEAARKLAERILGEGGPDAPQRLAWGFRTVISRPPSTAEQKILEAAFSRYTGQFTSNLAAAEKLVGVGQSPRRAQLNVVELAAYTTLASIMLNLDETITKE